jgi:hypothetical protein
MRVGGLQGAEQGLVDGAYGDSGGEKAFGVLGGPGTFVALLFRSVITGSSALGQ